MAFQVHDTERQRQVGWINENDWQFAKPEKRYRVRAAVAKALITLAIVLAPAARRAHDVARKGWL